MNRVVNRPAAGQAVFIGLDVSRTKWVFNVRWEGQEQRRLSTPGELRHLHRLVEEYAQCRVHVGYEACGFGYEIAWWLRERGMGVVVAAPSRVERAPGLSVKTDRMDAAALACKLEQGRLKGIYIPQRREHERRQLSRTYGRAVRGRARAQIQLRSLMQEQGRIGPAPRAGWSVYARWLAQQPLPEPVAACVAELVEMREVAAGSAQRLRTALLKLAVAGEYAPVVGVLTEQRGVGPLTAIRLVLELGEITRFATAGSFVHYLGLTPSEHSSGDRVRRGHLLKCGPGYIRTWLLECAWRSILPHGDPELRQCYQRLHPRVGGKRAIVAVTRRLALRLRARWLAAVTPIAQAA